MFALVYMLDIDFQNILVGRELTLSINFCTNVLSETLAIVYNTQAKKISFILNV